MSPDLHEFRAALSRANPFVSVDDEELREVVATCRELWPDLPSEAFTPAVIAALLNVVGVDHQLPVAFGSRSPFNPS
jgi:hypothetical protein